MISTKKAPRECIITLWVINNCGYTNFGWLTINWLLWIIEYFLSFWCIPWISRQVTFVTFILGNFPTLIYSKAKLYMLFFNRIFWFLFSIQSILTEDVRRAGNNIYIKHFTRILRTFMVCNNFVTTDVLCKKTLIWMH